MLDCLAFDINARVPSGASRSQFPWDEAPWTAPAPPLVTIAPREGDVLPTHAVGNFERIFPFNLETLHAAQRLAATVIEADNTAKELKKNHNAEKNNGTNNRTDSNSENAVSEHTTDSNETSESVSVVAQGIIASSNGECDHESVLMNTEHLHKALKVRISHSSQRLSMLVSKQGLFFVLFFI